MHMQQQQQQGQMYGNMTPGGSGGVGVGAMSARGGVGPGNVPANVFGPGGQAQNALQGPLAYLEKTTSNIGKLGRKRAIITILITTWSFCIADLVGMGDGRR